MGRLIVAANRLPVSVSKQEDGLHVSQSPGGLAIGLASLPDSVPRLWLGWPGIATDDLEPQDQEQIIRELAAGNCLPVYLSRE